MVKKNTEFTEINFNQIALFCSLELESDCKNDDFEFVAFGLNFNIGTIQGIAENREMKTMTPRDRNFLNLNDADFKVKVSQFSNNGSIRILEPIASRKFWTLEVQDSSSETED